VKYLFSNEGMRALVTVLNLKPLLAFDFDGTLAPIVAHPDDVRVAAAVSHRLAQLALWRPVAIVTGRKVADVAPRLGFEPAYIVGSHGAEDPELATSFGYEVALTSARSYLAAHAAVMEDAGVTIEDKGKSLALHYRLARDREKALQCIESVIVNMGQGLHTFGGKFVVNIVAGHAPDKGDAVQRLVVRSKSDSALFVGDDVNDEAVFQIAPDHWLTVRIGQDASSSSAKFFLDSHAEMTHLLQILIDLRPA
jgi:trehalose 6-phosphate phosphatase